MAPQFSCHAVRVKLDRDTGVARVLHVSAAHDSGTIINPIGATGQVEGAVLMGIGQALTEGTRYDDQAKQRNAALLEYKLQTCADAPQIDIHFVRDQHARRRATWRQGPRRGTQRGHRRGHLQRHRQDRRHTGPPAADDGRARVGDVEHGREPA